MQNSTLTHLYDAVNEAKTRQSSINNLLISPKLNCTGTFIARSSGILSGVQIIEPILKYVNKTINVELLKNNGDFLNKGDAICCIKGKMKDIMLVEKLICSYLQLLSGVASIADKYVSEVKDLDCILYGNDNYYPLMSELYHNALIDGGMHVKEDDVITINNDHLLLSNGLENCIDTIKSEYPNEQIELCVYQEEEIDKAVEQGINRILLINPKESLIDYALNIKDSKINLGISCTYKMGAIRSIIKKGIDYLVINNIDSQAKGLEIYFKVYKRTFK